MERSSTDGVRAVQDATETADAAQTPGLEGIAAKRTTLERLAAEKVPVAPDLSDLCAQFGKC